MKTPKGATERAAYEACEHWAKFNGGIISLCFDANNDVVVRHCLKNVLCEMHTLSDVAPLANVLRWLSHIDHDNIAQCKTMDELTSALAVAGWQLECIYRGYREYGYRLSTWALDAGCERLDKKGKVK